MLNIESAKQQLINMNNPNKSKLAVAQYNADAKLSDEFEHSKEDPCNSFNYTESVKSSLSGEQITAYLSKMQRGGYIQSFGCLFAIEEPCFRILAYSENSTDLLGLNTSVKSTQFECLLGFDARIFFTEHSASSLTKAASYQDLSLANPVWVVSESTQTPFLAILHRIDVGILIDFEPAIQGDPAFTIDGAIRLQKLALQAISRLQSLPGSDIDALYDTVVENVKELTGYDRVMIYKFHEDEHGEVVSEKRRNDLEPYLGLHYPAIDIPQAARFLFKKNRMRLICNCRANPVRVIRSVELERPLVLVNSTLRAPHGCHAEYMANMGSVGTLVMAIMVNENNIMKLWGLVSCHHVSPRYIPYPIRHACEFMMQAFGLQLSIAFQLALHAAEKKILKTKTMMSDMVLKEDPFGIVTKSPSIMDLVNCNGAAFCYGGVYRMLGVTPSELQLTDITEWLLAYDKDLTVWSTDSLTDVGYPHASTLGDAVCGVAAARIAAKNFLFWFRSETEKEIKWGGANNHKKDKDDGKRMHPRSSFQAFLEVVKNKSVPWKSWEMNTIRLLQLTLQGSFQDIDNDGAKMTIRAYQTGLLTNEMTRMIDTAIAPILAVDLNGNINRWNLKVAELTGLPASEAVGRSLVYELVHEESRGDFGNCLSRALQGEEDDNVGLRLKTLGKKQPNESVFIVANACSCKDYANNVTGVCFVGRDVTEVEILKAKFMHLQEDYKAINTQSLNPLIPPLFATDENARCSANRLEK
ncbi:hypothetical protein IFM89_028636 [Coptis chinensis]|uniref:Phytochrome E n=1 Tax=Coptis chinensis TaxID=261450 RepID=A0A835H0W4_9MAGN|nr:hypothetical protein IFM89_028636 [Coptis chinensis]